MAFWPQMLAVIGGCGAGLLLALPARAVQEAVCAALSGQAPPRWDRGFRAAGQAFGRKNSGWQASWVFACAAGLGSIGLSAGGSDPFLIAALLMAARMMLWAQAGMRDDLALAFDRVAEWRGVLAGIVLVGLNAACRGPLPGGGHALVLGGIMVAAGVVVALSGGVLSARDPLLARQGRPPALDVACGALGFGWLVWCGQIIWQDSASAGESWSGLWAALLRVGLSVIVGSVGLGAAQALVFPKFRSGAVAASLLLGGLGIMLMLGEAG